MNTCGTCAHRRHRDAVLDTAGDVVIPEQDTCSLMTSDSSRAKHPESRAMAQDAEGYRAWLEVQLDFGCNQWTEEP